MRKNVTHTIRMNSGIKCALLKAAEKERRSVASLMEKILVDWLDTHEIEWKESVSERSVGRPHKKPLAPPKEKSSQKPMTGKELVEALEKSGFIGMWADRTDIGDSSEYARKLREQAEKREWD